MRLASFLAFALLLSVTACTTVPQGGYSSAPTDRTYNAGYDRVWGVLVGGLSAKYTIKNIDKASGLITLEPVTLGSGILTPSQLRPYAYEPANLLGTWSDSRAIVSFYVSKQGKGTNVRVTAQISAFENNVTHTWQPWVSKGVIEQTFLNSTSEHLGEHGS